MKKEDTKKLNTQKGITLVALIITIIVLLILAVVAIRAVTGDGILQYAKKSQQEQKFAQLKEEVQLALNEWAIAKHATSGKSEDAFKTFLEGKFENVTVNEEGTYTITKYEQSVLVNENGMIELPTGEMIGTNTVRIGDLVYVINPDNQTATVYGARKDVTDYSTFMNYITAEIDITAEHIGIDSNINVDGIIYEVTAIGNWAFGGMIPTQPTFTSIFIPDNVTTISASAFPNNANLTNIYYNGSATGEPWGATNATIIKDKEAYAKLQVALDEWQTYKETEEGANTEFVDFLKEKFGANNVVDNNDGTYVVTVDGIGFEVDNFPTGELIGTNTVRIGDLVYVINNSTAKTAKVYGYRGENATYGGNITSELPITSQNITIEPKVKINGRIYTVDTIGYNAFGDRNNDYGAKSIIKVTIPDTVTTIDWAAFSNCTSLKEINIPNSVTSISNDVFYNCTSLAEITIPKGIKAIGGGTFGTCTSLSEIEIPEGITEIDNAMFSGCTSLIKVIIPDSVIRIGSTAFNGCTKLETIEIPNAVSDIGLNAFYGTPWLDLQRANATNGIIIINNVLLEAKESVEIPNNIVCIAGEAFKGNKLIEEAIIPNTVKIIGDGAFANCESLVKIIIPEGVTSIGEFAFINCAFTKVEIPSTVTTMEEDVFLNCSNLTDIYIPGLTEVPSGWSRYWNSSDVTVHWGEAMPEE